LREEEKQESGERQEAQAHKHKHKHTANNHVLVKTHLYHPDPQGVQDRLAEPVGDELLLV
jgi:hypothetical protein